MNIYDCLIQCVAICQQHDLSQAATNDLLDMVCVQQGHDPQVVKEQTPSDKELDGIIDRAVHSLLNQ